MTVTASLSVKPEPEPQADVTVPVTGIDSAAVNCDSEPLTRRVGDHHHESVSTCGRLGRRSPTVTVTRGRPIMMTRILTES